MTGATIGRPPMVFRKLALATAAALIAGAAFSPAAVVVAKSDKVKAKIHQGTLEVTGSNSAESIALRLQAGDPTVLEIVVDGAFSESFERSRFVRLSVDADGGDDIVAIDEGNGPFTAAIPTTLAGG